MQFGIASIDITPPVGVVLWGYIPRPSTWIEHPLRAEALACEANGHGWVLISADVGGFTRPLTDVIREDVAKLTGLSATEVMITATHTHSGPHVTDALWCERSEVESAYFVWLRTQLVAVAEKAWLSRTDGDLLHGRTTAPDLASNRRVQNLDGTWGNAFRDPEGKHTGYYDPTIDLLGIRRPDGSLEALMVNFGCHPVSYGSGNLGVSADYVGYMKDALEAMKIAKTVMFTVSGHGNIDPRNGVQNAQNVVRRMGEDLAGIVSQGIAELTRVSGTGVVALHEPWSFCTTWDLDGRMAIYFPHVTPGETVNTAISCVAAGDCVLLGLPGETVSEYRKKFGLRSPFGITLLISLANDCIGYLPTDEILEQGAYEAKHCPCHPIEEVLTEQVDAVLAKAKNKLCNRSRVI